MTNVPHHIETSQLICIANQLTGFCRMGNIGCQWVKKWVKLDLFHTISNVNHNLAPYLNNTKFTSHFQKSAFPEQNMVYQ